MNCPKCNHPVSEGQTVCEQCGEKLAVRQAEENDDGLDFVYSRRSSKKNKNSKYRRNLLVVAIAALAATAVVLGGMWFLRSRNKKEPTLPAFLTSAPVTAEPETTVPVTAAPTAHSGTVAPETTVPPTTLHDETADYEEKLAAYIRKTGLYNTLSAAADSNTELSLAVENNLVIATYRVNADENAEADEEYISTLAGVFEDVCAQLDGYVYEMKTKSGVPTAVLQLTAFDKMSNIIFSDYID